MRTKITLSLTGQDKNEIENKAIDKISNFLDIDRYDVENKCDIEFSIEEAEVGYSATVYVRVK